MPVLQEQKPVMAWWRSAGEFSAIFFGFLPRLLGASVPIFSLQIEKKEQVFSEPPWMGLRCVYNVRINYKYWAETR